MKHFYKWLQFYYEYDQNTVHVSWEVNWHGIIIPFRIGSLTEDEMVDRVFDKINLYNKKKVYNWYT